MTRLLWCTLPLLLFLPSITTAQPQILASFNASDSPWLPTQNKRLISPSRTFTAGFLPSPTSSGSFIFSIFYTSFNNTVVWSSAPVSSSSSLSISPSGVLSLNNTSWTVPSTSPPNPQLTLSDSGDLTFANWSSFKFPTDTILPEQIIPPTGKTLVNGNFSLVNATSLVFGPNDSYWSFTNSVALLNLTSGGSLMFQDGSSLIAADVDAPNRLRRLTLGPDGNLKVYSAAPGSGNWTVVWRAIQERCTIHGTCGTGMICATIDGYDDFNCLCPPGFDRDSDGQSCRRRIPLTPADDKFLRLDFVSFADGATPLSDPSALNFEGCRSYCARNASCVAFGYKFSGSQSCMLNTRLVNGYWSPATELATFLRVSRRESATSNFTGMSTMLETTCPVRIRLPVPRSDSNSTTWNLAIICSLFAVELLAGDRPEARPSMGKVAKMLEGLVEITEPGRPTIFYLNEEE
ncbi:putative receptor protein kinase ZmPK1 [Acorus calamus]|uniref:non-specific serine/threonine protein kinase n=1 Tax=Acorus calamus TaxID=4465 RepID=A0AAV9ELE4_ACOCL|nr:putative receptor protein kinase ZmPK1 [Acorus calamus]